MKAYAIKDPSGRIILSTIRGTQTISKSAIENSADLMWTDLYHMGYRCVPVEITEIKK